MNEALLPPRKLSLRACTVFVLLACAGSGFAQDDGNVIYLSEYLYGDYYYAPLGDIDRNNPRMIRPRKLRLPGNFRSSVHLGNHDVSYDGTRIVFAARDRNSLDWDIYRGSIDLDGRRIHGIERLTDTVDTRDEDPRFSWDGTQVVYKCDGDICVYPAYIYINPVVRSECELWAPSFDYSGYSISYGKRCSTPENDEVWYYRLLSGEEAKVPGAPGVPDRFAYFLDDDSIVYSHTDASSQRSSLWLHTGGGVSLMHDRTESDDDPYPDRHDRDHIAFIGWQNGGYDLFVYRRERGDSVQLTSNIPVLAPVLFR